MSYTVTQESFDRLTSYWTDSSYQLKWGSIFILPSWLEVWWQIFQPGTELYLIAVREQSDIIGMAPLQVRGKEAFFVGSPDVCDYQDFIIVPGREKDFFNVLLDDLKQRGIGQLSLESVRPDSAVMTSLVDIARNRGFEVLCREGEVSVELDLPATWDDYLAGLDKKQRHEVRRKLRRLLGAGDIVYRCQEVSPQQVDGLMDIFLRLFTLSREEKAEFMTARMESFFRSLAKTMAGLKLLRFGILEVDKVTAAMIMGFDYNETMYLYNSGYDPRYDSLSVGLLSKALCIRESIQQGKKKWDFLKGAEKYKYQLGGKEIPLYNCRITIK
jgi:CelD/BcsL family acetyltransferase involved in cellulose biosynthesis